MSGETAPVFHCTSETKTWLNEIIKLEVFLIPPLGLIGYLKIQAKAHEASALSK